MIKRILVALPTVALSALALAAPASTAAHAATDSPQNGIPTSAFHLKNENWPNDCARIDGAGALIIGSGDCTTFTSSDGEIKTAGECLYYDKTGARDGDANSYDLSSCGSSAVPSDSWLSTGQTGWTQWYTVYNDENGGESMWADGTGTSYWLYAQGMNGTSDLDHWESYPAS